MSLIQVSAFGAQSDEDLVAVLNMIAVIAVIAVLILCSLHDAGFASDRRKTPTAMNLAMIPRPRAASVWQQVMKPFCI